MNHSFTKAREIARELRASVRQESHNLARFIELLAALDGERGFARLGYPSLFDFCTKHLCLTNGEAATRVRLAKLSRRELRVVDVLRSGEVGMCCLRILAPVLNSDNFESVVCEAKGKSARELEFLKSRWQKRECQSSMKRNAIRFESTERSDGADDHGDSGSGNGNGSGNGSGVKPAGVDTCPVAHQYIQTNSDTYQDCATTTQVSEQRLNPEKSISSASSAEGSSNRESTPRERKYIRISASIREDVWNKYEQACAYADCGSGPKDLSIMFEKMVNLFLERERSRRKIKDERKDTPTSDTTAQTLSRDSTEAKVTALREDKDTKMSSSCDAGSRSASSTSRREADAAEKDKATLPKSEHRQAKPSRYIPRIVAAEVWQRDGGQCRYISPINGRRCECKRGLQIDHIVPFARGGTSRSASNLRLLCPTHNRIAADDLFGIAFMDDAVTRERHRKRNRNQERQS